MREIKADIYNVIIWYLLVWIVFQDFFLGIFYHVTRNEVLTNLLFYSKDVLMILLFVWALFRNKYFNRRIIVWEFLYLCVFLAATVNAICNTTTGIKGMLASMRGILLLPVFVIIGYGIGNKQYFREAFVKKYCTFLVFVAVFGIVEFLLDKYVGTKKFWTDIVEIGKYMIDIKGQAARLVMGLPGNFYGSYGGAFFSQKRLVSFFGGPLTAAYALALPCILYFVQILNEKSQGIGYIKTSKIKNIIMFSICFLAILMSYTRTMILLVTVVFVIYFFRKTKKYHYLWAMLPVGAIFALINYQKIWKYLYDGSTVGHIKGIVGAIKNITFWGEGIGSFGVNSMQGTESTYLTVLGQLGVVGIIIYIMGFLLPIYYYKRYVLRERLDSVSTMVLLGIFVYAGSGIVSEQLTAYTTIVPFFILLGCELGYLLENDILRKRFGGINENRNSNG